jgi:hypothetical protein
VTADRTAEQRRIDAYADDFARHLAVGVAQRARRRTELAAHLADAAEAGELDAALARLGNPRDAARQFTAPGARPAPIGRRLAAAAIDNLPLIAVTVALTVHGALRVGDGGSFTLFFPPVLHIEIGGVCLTFLPIGCGAGLYPGAGALASVGIPLALAWSIVGVGLVESRTGRTPGKALLRLRTGTEDGLKLRPSAGLVRRASLLAGPLAWVDWIPFLWGDRRRLLDRAVGARVTSDDGP